MKLVRNSVFETNSSSCHSITLGSKDVFEGFTPNSDGKIILDTYEFGWGYDKFSSVEARLAYLWIYIRDWSNNNQKFLDMYKKVVFEHTGATEIDMPPTKTSWGNDEGYIDHQAVEDGDCDEYFKNKSTLKRFLFGAGTEIICDNDNH